MDRKRSFPPVVDKRTRLLLLGSLPGEVSLKEGRYYANPRNAFWLLMSRVLDEDLLGMSYEKRLATLLRRGVGLWDVVAEARRRGSLDSAIEEAAGNDLRGLVETLPRLKALAFNGAAAAKLGTAQLGEAADRLRLIRLPSSSPAYAGRLKLKTQAWMTLREHLE